MALFDTVSKVVVDVTNTVFGDLAIWLNKATGVTYTGLVKFQDNKGQEKLGDVKYAMDKWTIEFKDSDFPGLKDSVNMNKKEKITVSVRGGDNVFYVKSANAKSDGFITIATMQAAP